MRRLTSGAPHRTLAFVACAAIFMAQAAAAQTSRTDERARQQAEKASRLRPPERSGAERLVGHVEQLLSSGSNGVYPWFGSVMGGGWLAMGGLYGQPLGDTGRVTVLGAWSLRNYRLFRATARLPAFVDRRLTARLDGTILDANKVAFYGLGPRSSRRDRSSFRIRPAEANASLSLRVAGPFSVGAALGALAMETGDGVLRPAVTEIFDAAEAPGLGASPRYTVSRAFASVDWRESPGYSRRGGLYRIEWSRHAERGRDGHDFDRTEIELVQLVPILRGQWVLAVRGFAAFSQPVAGGVVPYFLMPTLGGSTTVRGLSNDRLRDRQLALLQVEYRWAPSHFLDMALFADAGTVAPRRAELSLRRVQTAYGIGFRFHSPTAVVLRADLAWSREGMRVILGSGAGF